MKKIINFVKEIDDWFVYVTCSTKQNFTCLTFICEKKVRGLFMFNDWRWEVIVRFVEIGGIYCWQSLFNFLFTNKCQTGEILFRWTWVSFHHSASYIFIYIYNSIWIDTCMNFYDIKKKRLPPSVINFVIYEEQRCSNTFYHYIFFLKFYFKIPVENRRFRLLICFLLSGQSLFFQKKIIVPNVVFYTWMISVILRAIWILPWLLFWHT
jgi:hypothetical protein